MDNNVIKQTTSEIMRSSEKLGEVRDIASAILTIGEISDASDRMTILNALAHRLFDIGLESSVIWVKAHDIWTMIAKEERLQQTPEQELEAIENDLPFV